MQNNKLMFLEPKMIVYALQQDNVALQQAKVFETLTREHLSQPQMSKYNINHT